MGDARLARRIQVVVVTTRAAASSLQPLDGEVHAAVTRGIQLLDGMADEVAGEGDPALQELLTQARSELTSMLDGRRP
jgi:hypothetical protein